MLPDSAEGKTLIYVVNSEVRLASQGVDPEPATLLAHAHPFLDVYLNQRPVQGQLSVSATDQLQVVVRQTPPTKRAEIQIMEDGLTAELHVVYEPGVKRSLRPCSPAERVALVVEEEEDPPAQFALAEILELLKDRRVTAKPQLQDIVALLAQRESGSCVCATGQPVIEGVPEHYQQMVFESSGVELVGIYPLKPVCTVRKDTLVAQRVQAVEGIPGMTVTGQAILPKPLKTRLQRLGKGVHEDEAGGVYAVRGGRVVFENKLIDVSNILEHHGNYEVTDGHIRFDGDVVIRGDVGEGVQVSALGQVFVSGSVSHATILADGGIVVSGGVFGSKLHAGTRILAGQVYRGLIDTVCEHFPRLVSAVAEVTKAMALRGANVPPGRIALKLMEEKFADLMDWPNQFAKWEQQYRQDAEEKWLEVAKRISVELDPVTIQSLTSVERWTAFLEFVRGEQAELPDYSNPDVDIQIKNGQTSEIHSTGQVLTTGQGLYQCHVKAGSTVEAQGAPGVILGCTVVAGNAVNAREIGSQAGSHTAIEILDKEGQVSAHIIHEETVLTLGPWRKKLITPMQDAVWP